jgi:hypothetical protein
MTVLECHHQKPFDDGWSDWSAPEESVVLTFQTMDDQLYEVWRDQCMFTEDHNHEGGIERTIGMTVDHSEFDPDGLRPPGIHRDHHPNDPDLVDESYVIIIPNNRLHPEICEKWIERLNSEYGRRFELSYSSDE